MSRKNIFNVILLVLSAAFIVVKGISDNACLSGIIDETE